MVQNRSKWLDQVSAGDSVPLAAKLTLKARLSTVVHFLDLAANHPDKTPEHVHQLRVYTRRSLAAFDVYQEVFPKKRAKWFRKWLRRIRKAAGDARDLDVFLLRYEKERDPHHATFVHQLKKRRRKAQRPIRGLYAELIPTGRLERHIDRLLKPLASKPVSDDQRLGPWARLQLERTAGNLFKAIPEQRGDLEALHRFRLRGKELRYTMELFSTVFPAELRTSVYPLVSELQDRLGELNDHATACDHLQAWCDQADSDREAEQFRRLIAREQKQLKVSIEWFEQWWTPEFATNLELSLATMTAGSTM